MIAVLRRFRPRREKGYTLVVLAVGVSVLSVLVAAALPHWSQAMQREKEEELIFRGWQYAEAIRIFAQRTGRHPTTLKELMEVKPRSIRKLWKDPMDEKAQWGVIVQGVGPTPGAPGGVPVGGQGGGQPTGIGPGSSGNFGGGIQGDDPGQNDDGSGGNPTGLGGGQGGPGTPGTPVGPITGVRSRVKGEAIKTLFGKEKYSEWEFTVEALASGGRSNLGGAPVVPPGAGRPGQPPQNPNPLPGFTGATAHPQLPRTAWIGRPFREGLQPGGGTVPPGGLQQGGLPGGGSFGGNSRPPDSPPPVGDDDN